MATLRHQFAATLAVVTVCAVLIGSASAEAQTAYPPSPPTTVLCVGGTVDAGTVAVGQTITITLCGPWQPGSTVTATVATLPAVDVTAGAEGSLGLTITASSCGVNRVVATGPGVLAATATAFATFSVTCAAAASGSALPFTGANIVKLLVAALILIGVGAALVVAYRRRSAS